MAKSKYPVGAKVRVINPEVLVRCGYPETIKSAREKMLEIHGDKIREFMFSMKFVEQAAIIDKMARDYLRHELKFGGRERKIYTKTMEELRGEVFEIDFYDRPKIHKTGTYYSGYSGGGYWDDYDYEPPSLEDVVTHVFYPITGRIPAGELFRTIGRVGAEIWIERNNLEIIEE